MGKLQKPKKSSFQHHNNFGHVHSFARGRGKGKKFPRFQGRFPQPGRPQAWNQKGAFQWFRPAFPQQGFVQPQQFWQAPMFGTQQFSQQPCMQYGQQDFGYGPGQPIKKK